MNKHFLSSLATVTATSLVACTVVEPDPEQIPSKEVPPPPEGAQAGDGSGAMFAVTKLHIGTHTPNGTQDSNAWRLYGYNRDGLMSDGTEEGHCRPNSDASASNVFVDASGGSDNAFGHIVLPALGFWFEYASDDGQNQLSLEQHVNAELGGSTSGLVFHLRDLGSKDAYEPIDSFVYEARSDVGGNWHVEPTSVQTTEGDFDEVLGSARLHDPSSYVTDDTWVAVPASGEDNALSVQWDLAGLPLQLVIHHPIITMEMDAAHDGATNGIVSGILDTEEFVEAFRTTLGRADSSFCEGSAVEALLNQLRQASDIMKDGTQNPDAVCDGISIAFGFDATRALVVGVAEPRPTTPDPCLTRE